MNSDVTDTVDLLLDVQGSLEIVRMLEDNENILSEFYLSFAKSFPGYKDFWTTIASDERKHADWVSVLYEEVNKGRLNFDKERFDKNLLKSFHDDISAHISHHGKSSISMRDAVTLSMHIEENMLEEGFFKVFDADTEILRLTLDRLRSSTQIHYRKIRELADIIPPMGS